MCDVIPAALPAQINPCDFVYRDEPLRSKTASPHCLVSCRIHAKIVACASSRRRTSLLRVSIVTGIKSQQCIPTSPGVIPERLIGGHFDSLSSSLAWTPVTGPQKESLVAGRDLKSQGLSDFRAHKRIIFSGGVAKRTHSLRDPLTAAHAKEIGTSKAYGYACLRFTERSVEGHIEESPRTAKPFATGPERRKGVTLPGL